MNILIIPSWYPNEKSPISGIFIKEQVEALAELYPEMNFVISLCSDLSYSLHFKKPIYSINVLRKYSQEKSYLIKKKRNLIEIYNPVLLWTDKLNGYNRNLVKANLKNYLLAEKEFGRIDVVHCHVSYPAGYIGMKLSEKNEIPYIITEHMSPFPFNSYKIGNELKDEIKLPLLNAKVRISVSKSGQKGIEYYGIESPIIIPNLVNEDFFVIKDVKAREKFTFFTLGGMIPQKGILDLLNAIKNVVNIRKNLCFKIGGTGYELDKYKEFSEMNNIDGYISWLGQLTPKQALDEFHNSNCFILTSKHESFGVVYAEAIACGKPVIATKCGGPEDIVNEENGLLVETGNIEEISNAILYMTDNINKYDSKKIREDFLNRFSRKVVTEKIVNVYKECLK